MARERAYLVLDLTTGAMDGWYFPRAMAVEALHDMERMHPRGRWVLLENCSPRHGIPDHLFWLNRLGWPPAIPPTADVRP